MNSIEDIPSNGPLFTHDRCTPYEYLWDRRIPGGYCQISAVPASTILNSELPWLSNDTNPQAYGAYQYAVTTVIVDLLFAVLPWLFIWTLQINKQEKIIIMISMSFGVLYDWHSYKRSRFCCIC